MDPALFVIFGATGDLTHRKLLPALYKLYLKKSLPSNFAVVAVARREKTDEDYRKDAFESLKKNGNNIQYAEGFLERVYYIRNDFDSEAKYPELKNFLDSLDEKHGTQGNRIFYLATLPDHFEPITANLKKYCFIDRASAKKYRIIIEKPFGSDLSSARKLNKFIKTAFREEEIFRIDHYLGKETVQNLFALRFANQIFKPIWKAEYIENIQITAAESLGVETRAGFYDKTGAVKDVMQNHLLQVLTLVAMETPESFTSEEIKRRKLEVFRAIRIPKDMDSDFVFAQYKEGIGKSYSKEAGVDKDTKTETYAAVKLEINNRRWKGMPIYLRTGKAMKQKATEVIIYFKDTKVGIFPQPMPSNVLVIRLQPNESINLRFNAKKPGNTFEIQRVSMDFCHDCLFDANTPEAYEKLIYDALQGDSTMFTRWDEVEWQWKIVDPLADYMNNHMEKLVYYPSGTWGPKEADMLLDRKGHHWRLREGK